MKYIYLISFSFFISLHIFGQQTPEQITETKVYQKQLEKTVTTLKLNVISYASVTINNFKSEIQEWNGKVISVSLDSTTNVLSVVHNALWQQQEIYEMLLKHGISQKRIISDN